MSTPWAENARNANFANLIKYLRRRFPKLWHSPHTGMSREKPHGRNRSSEFEISNYSRATVFSIDGHVPWQLNVNWNCCAATRYSELLFAALYRWRTCAYSSRALVVVWREHFTILAIWRKHAADRHAARPCRSHGCHRFVIIPFQPPLTAARARMGAPLSERVSVWAKQQFAPERIRFVTLLCAHSRSTVRLAEPRTGTCKDHRTMFDLQIWLLRDQRLLTTQTHFSILSLD